MASTIFTNDIFSEIILPFVLVFVVLFAILQKTKILGDGKKQIDSIVSLVIALIVISFSYATGIIVKLMPFLAVAVIVILVLVILLGFVSGGKEAYVIPKGLKVGVSIVAGIALIVAVLWASGSLGDVWEYLFDSDFSGNLFTNIVFLLVIGGVIAIALTSGKSGGSGGGSSG